MGITNGNGNKTRLNLGLGMEMGINHWEWEGMGLKKRYSRSSLVTTKLIAAKRTHTHKTILKGNNSCRHCGVYAYVYDITKQFR